MSLTKTGTACALARYASPKPTWSAPMKAIHNARVLASSAPVRRNSAGNASGRTRITMPKAVNAKAFSEFI
jgi:hypothetical protein